MNTEYGDKEYSPEEAFTLMQKGIWMNAAGYTWRNVDGHGEYFAHGEYPGCIRPTEAFTLDEVKSVCRRKGKEPVPWRRVEEKNGTLVNE